jgi:hypothetical protein
MDKLEGADELGYGAYTVQLRMVRKKPKLKGALSPVEESLRLLPTFLNRNEGY